jgi:hypothetical protein
VKDGHVEQLECFIQSTRVRRMGDAVKARRTSLAVGAALALAITVALSFAVATASSKAHRGTDQAAAVESSPRLTDDEFEAALAVARKQAASQARQVTLATATVIEGTPTVPSNTGTACSSGRLLNISLFGTFNIVTGGMAGNPNGGEVTELDMTADAVTGRPCVIEVATGTPTPDRSATVLFGSEDSTT